jgi:aromatic ring-opening dioxygenase catalytic subunit (LigB family)
VPDLLPTLFIPHGGGPCFFMEWNPPDTWHKLGAWLSRLSEAIGGRPKTIVVISGHWEEPEFTITGGTNPPLIYDYYGFPENTYRIEYAAPGSPELVERIGDLLASAGVPVRADAQRGFDHGVFIPFKLIYPQADIPIVQLSLKSGLAPRAHLDVGRALQPLRREGVLVVGSGMSYHNMRGFGGGAGKASDQFDAWLTEAVCAVEPTRRDQELGQWLLAPSAGDAHPREEHLIPLMVAVGAAGSDAGSKIFTDRIMGATISAFGFGMPG